MFRATWFLFNVLAVTIWYGTKVIVAGVFGVPNRSGGVYDEAMRRWGRRLLKAAGTEVTTVGLEKLPIDRTLVYVSNHQSVFDIFALASMIPGQMRFVAKKEVLKVPLLGRAARVAGIIFIDRQNRQAAFSAYERAAAAIRAGLNAVVFGEGTRSRTGNLLPFKKGPFVLAIASGVPVVPVYCAGTFGILPKGSIRIRPRPIALMFGDPISTAGLDYEDRGRLLEETRRAIEQLRDDSKRVLG